jgi:hypothetical protein
MWECGPAGILSSMPTFLIEHRHADEACGAAFAAWRGFASPLRHGSALSTCAQGGHALWWVVEAADEPAALALLPRFVARRATVLAVEPVSIP